MDFNPQKSLHGWQFLHSIFNPPKLIKKRQGTKVERVTYNSRHSRRLKARAQERTGRARETREGRGSACPGNSRSQSIMGIKGRRSRLFYLDHKRLLHIESRLTKTSKKCVASPLLVYLLNQLYFLAIHVTFFEFLSTFIGLI